MSVATKAPKTKVIYTNFSHQGFTLIGASLIIFEFVFLLLYTDSSWFSFNLLPLGIPAIVITTFLAHYLLTWLSSPKACHLFSFIYKKCPPVVYRQWLQVDEKAITFGSRRVLWEGIDEVSLSIFGNLILKSRKICGENPADIILKLPFGALASANQKEFIELLQNQRPNIALDLGKNFSASKKIPFPKATNWIQGLAVIFLAAVLIDFGYSEFRYLEILKEYFLCHEVALNGATADATKHLQVADAMKEKPFPLSWISQKIMSKGRIAASLNLARSEALWALGKKEDALATTLKVNKEYPQALSYQLRLARLYNELGKDKELKEEVNKSISEHKHALLPRLYLIASLLADNQIRQAKESYDGYIKQLNNEVFQKEPVWPPGGETFLNELFHKDDLNFIFKKILKQ